MNRKISLSIYIVLFLWVIGLDRLTKYVVMNYFPDYDIANFLSIKLVFNRGISFGLFHSEAVATFHAVTFLIVCVISFLCFYTFSRLSRGQAITGEILVLAGSLSNVIDRVLHEGVVDFILVYWGSWSFPVFNFADMCIVMGVLFMLRIEYCGEQT